MNLLTLYKIDPDLVQINTIHIQLKILSVIHVNLEQLDGPYPK